MEKYFLPLLLLCIVVSSGNILAQDSISIYVAVDGFKNEDGVCRLLLFESEEGFPDSPKAALLMLNEIIRGQKAYFNFRIKPGKYAISILHDENKNKKMDKTWYGKPIEGFGTSNNPKVRFSPPDFEDSVLILNDSNHNITIKLYYM